MKLSQQQALFTLDVAHLIIFANNNDYRVVLKEVERTPEQAAIYSQRGAGIKNSLHIKDLAADIALFKNGDYLEKHEDYQFLGDYWESLSPMNRWGGNFIKHGGKIDDANHFERKPEQP